jgi:hypothetical protein
LTAPSTARGSSGSDDAGIVGLGQLEGAAFSQHCPERLLNLGFVVVALLTVTTTLRSHSPWDLSTFITGSTSAKKPQVVLA